jgi:hypothetical protein
MFFILALVSKQFRMMTRKEVKFILLTGILNLFLRTQLGAKTRAQDARFFSLWQPLLPVFVQVAVIMLGMEKPTRRRKIGLSL